MPLCVLLPSAEPAPGANTLMVSGNPLAQVIVCKALERSAVLHFNNSVLCMDALHGLHAVLASVGLMPYQDQAT